MNIVWLLLNYGTHFNQQVWIWESKLILQEILYQTYGTNKSITWVWGAWLSGWAKSLIGRLLTASYSGLRLRGRSCSRCLWNDSWDKTFHKSITVTRIKSDCNCLHEPCIKEACNVHLWINTLYLTLFRPGFFFASCNRWGASEAPRYNFKTAYAMAPKITQKNVLIISNFWGLLDWHNDVIWRHRDVILLTLLAESEFPQSTHKAKST